MRMFPERVLAMGTSHPHLRIGIFLLAMRAMGAPTGLPRERSPKTAGVSLAGTNQPILHSPSSRGSSSLPFFGAHSGAHLTGLELGQSPALAPKPLRSGYTSGAFAGENEPGDALEHCGKLARRKLVAFQAARRVASARRAGIVRFRRRNIPTRGPGSRSQALVRAAPYELSRFSWSSRPFKSPDAQRSDTS